MVQKDYKYSILSYGFGGYDKVREIENPEEDVEYIYVTDTPNLTSSTWNVVYDESLDGLSNYEKLYKVKYHPWNYVSCDLMIRMDSSVQIKQSLTPIMEQFLKEGYEIALMAHPYRSNLLKEYLAWITYRNLPIEKGNRFYTFLKLADWDENYKGLFQTTICIQKKSEKLVKLNEDIYNFIAFMNENSNEMDRNDQSYFSYIVDRFYSDIKLLPLSEQVIHSAYLQWCAHNSDNPIIKHKDYDVIDDDLFYVFNKPTQCMHF